MITTACGVGVDFAFGADVTIGDEEVEAGGEGVETDGEPSCVPVADVEALEGGAADFAESPEDVPQPARRIADDASTLARQNPSPLDPAIVTSQIHFLSEHTPVGPPGVGPKVLRPSPWS
jgi:hypothetical protein